MKIVCIGDSITKGFGIGVSKNWVSILDEQSKADFINRGVIGDTSGGMLARFYRDVIDEKPNYVLIMGGVNDLIMGNTLAIVKSNIMAMVHQSYHNKIFPIIGVPIKLDIENIRNDWFNFADFEYVIKKCEEFEKWIIDFSTVFKVAYINFGQEFGNKCLENYSSYFIDGIHPNKNAQVIMADLVKQNSIFNNYF